MIWPPHPPSAPSTRADIVDFPHNGEEEGPVPILTVVQRKLGHAPHASAQNALLGFEARVGTWNCCLTVLFAGLVSEVFRV